jgi:hypothetical protein
MRLHQSKARNWLAPLIDQWNSQVGAHAISDISAMNDGHDIGGWDLQ